MKKIHIVALIMIAIAAFIITSATKDVSTYATFEQAKNGKRVKIVGELAKDQDIIYNPDVDSEAFTFYLEDDNSEVQKVKLLKAKPQDFERAESIVVTGAMKDDMFVADEILMKCPSKYKDEELSLKAEAG